MEARPPQVPSGARVFLDTPATLVPDGERLRVVFWSQEMKSAGVALFGPKGNEIANVRMDLPHGFAEPTGLYHLAGNESTQIVLFGRVGAKAAWARVYAFEHGALRQVLDWSGWDFRIVTIGGETAIATRDLSHGVLTDLRVWRNGSFVKANDLFPDFYAADIKAQERFIKLANGPFAANFAEACFVVTQELLYGRRYAEAKEQCSRALEAIQSRCCSGARYSTASLVAEDREAAEQRIKQTISKIEVAEKTGLRSLS